MSQLSSSLQLQGRMELIRTVLIVMVTPALFMSCLNYYNALYMELPLKTTQKLQLAQNAADHY